MDFKLLFFQVEENSLSLLNIYEAMQCKKVRIFLNLLLTNDGQNLSTGFFAYDPNLMLKAGLYPAL